MRNSIHHLLIGAFLIFAASSSSAQEKKPELKRIGVKDVQKEANEKTLESPVPVLSKASVTTPRQTSDSIAERRENSELTPELKRQNAGAPN